jgi:hypothetical protein
MPGLQLALPEVEIKVVWSQMVWCKPVQLLTKGFTWKLLWTVFPEALLGIS